MALVSLATGEPTSVSRPASGGETAAVPATAVSDAIALPAAPLLQAATGRQGLGLCLALCSAGLYAVTTIAAAMAYGEGTNPATLIWLRFAISAAALALTARLLGRSLTIPRAQWPTFLCTAFGVMGMTNGYLTSVAFIPIELAVIIFYSFPLLVGIAEAMLERRRLAPLGLVCYLAAFGGLLLALGPRFDSLDWRGIALASLAAVSGVVTFLSSRRLARSIEPLAVACGVNLLGIVVGALVLLLTSELVLPDRRAGARLAMGIAYVARSISSLRAAFRLFRSSRPPVLSLRFATAAGLPVAIDGAVPRFEPALTVLAAWQFLGASHSGGQGLGVALILGALFAAPLASSAPCADGRRLPGLRPGPGAARRGHPVGRPGPSRHDLQLRAGGDGADRRPLAGRRLRLGQLDGLGLVLAAWCSTACRAAPWPPRRKPSDRPTWVAPGPWRS